MQTKYSDVYITQERKFKNHIMRDFDDFKKNYQTRSKEFSFLPIGSYEYEVQKFFDIRVEHYIRTFLFTELLCGLFKGNSYISSVNTNINTNNFYSTEDFEKLYEYEFKLKLKDRECFFRYIPFNNEEEINDGLFDVTSEIIILNLLVPSYIDSENDSVQTINDIKVSTYCLRRLFEEFFDIDEYEVYVSFLERLVIEYQEYIGVKSVSKFAPTSLGIFRFDAEKEILKFITDIKKHREIEKINPKADLKYGYTIITKSNADEFENLEQKTNDMLFDEGLIEKFETEKLYLYLLGNSAFSKSFFTAEYLYKQYYCDDCIDYTAIISGYLKSVEQLLYSIILLHINKNYYIKYGKGKNSLGEYPKKYPDPHNRNLKKVDFHENNINCIDSTMGSLWHFLDDYKNELLLLKDEKYRDVLIDCLDCYTDECRNGAFHKHNVNSWSKVEFVRKNTYFLYIVLLSSIKLGETNYDTTKGLNIIKNFKIERLYYLISQGITNKFLFLYHNGDTYLPPLEVVYVGGESSFPTFNNNGMIKNIYLTFEDTITKRKVIVTEKILPLEIYYKNSNNECILVE